MTKRTEPQNNSIHKYCDSLARKLNAAGLGMREILMGKLEKHIMAYVDKVCPKSRGGFEEIFNNHAKKIDISWTKESVKEGIWRPVQKAMFKIESTTDLTTGQVSKVYDEIHKHFAEKHGIDVPFPSNEPPMMGR